jgi:FixJ family two-component response regulator
MLTHVMETPVAQIGISLVDGDPSVRRDRQLMLRSENFNVRSYATCAAMIADPNARASACFVVDVDMPEMGGVELLRKMRTSGWQGAAILLQVPGRDDGVTRSSKEHVDTLLPKTIADRALLEAIRSALNQGAAPFTA